MDKYPWHALFDAINNSPSKYPVNAWNYRPPSISSNYGKMDIWPLMKMFILLRFCNLVHAEVKSILIPPDHLTPLNRLATEKHVPFRRARRMISNMQDYFVEPISPPTLGRLRRHSVLDPKSNVLFFGSRIGCFAVDKYFLHNHIDPVRLVVEELGHRSATLLLDVPPDDPILEKTLLSGSFSFQAEFSHFITAYVSTAPIRFSLYSGFCEWYNDMKDIFDIDLIVNRRALDSVIKRTYSWYLFIKNYLTLNKVDAVFTYSYYGVFGYGASMACRELGIPLVDIQHGVAGSPHESYNWPGMPEGGYNILPTHFLTWSNVESDQINSDSSENGPLALVAGNSWRLIDDLLSSNEEYILIESGRLESARRAYRSYEEPSVQNGNQPRRTRILLTLHSGEDVAWLHPLLFGRANSWQFLVRIHPGEARDPKTIRRRVKELQRDGVEVERPSKLPLATILKEVDIHLTKYSSSVLDAAAFGIPSICYSSSADWFYSDSSADYVRVVEKSAEAVRSAIEQECRKESSRQRPVAGQLAADLPDVVRQILTQNSNT